MEAKEKKLTSKKRRKFASQLDFTPNVIILKYKEIETAKKHNERCKNTFKNTREKNRRCGQYALRMRNVDVDIIKTNEYRKVLDSKQRQKGLIVDELEQSLLIGK